MERHIFAGIVAVVLATFFLFAGPAEFRDLEIILLWVSAAAAMAGFWIFLGERWVGARSLIGLACATALVSMAWHTDPRDVPSHLIAAFACGSIGIASSFIGSWLYLAWSPKPRMKP